MHSNVTNGNEAAIDGALLVVWRHLIPSLPIQSHSSFCPRGFGLQKHSHFEPINDSRLEMEALGTMGSSQILASSRKRGFQKGKNTLKSHRRLTPISSGVVYADSANVLDATQKSLVWASSCCARFWGRERKVGHIQRYIFCGQAINPSPSPKKATPTSVEGCQTALSFLQSNPDFGMLLQLINATPPKAHLHGE